MRPAFPLDQRTWRLKDDDSRTAEGPHDTDSGATDRFSGGNDGLAGDKIGLHEKNSLLSVLVFVKSLSVAHMPTRSEVISTKHMRKTILAALVAFVGVTALAGRDIKTSSTASVVDTQRPTAPGNVRIVFEGTRLARIAWEAATDNSGSVVYEVEKDGANPPLRVDALEWSDGGLLPGTNHGYRVRAVDPSGNVSVWKELIVRTASDEVENLGFLLGEIFDRIPGTDIASFVASDVFQNKRPTRGVYLNGLDFDGLGDNYGILITGVLTAPKTGQFDFFVRSDDASQFYLNETGPEIPSPGADLPIAEETGCCNAFQEPGAAQTTQAPILLNAGGQYGFAFVVKEGVGGDFGQVAMRQSGDPTPAATLQPIRGTLLTGTADATGVELTITAQPVSATTIANERVAFAVGVQHFSPYGAPRFIQWVRNGEIIPGATSERYTIPYAPEEDNGALFKVIVGTLGKSLASDEVMLTVEEDNKAPRIASVIGSDTMHSATVRFSEPITKETATTVGNYSLSGGVTVSRVTQIDPLTVRLATSRQTEDTEYTLKVENLRDNAGNRISPVGNIAILRSFRFVSGVLKWQFWSDVTGGLGNLRKDPRYPEHSTEERLLGAFEGPTGFADNFGSRITGFVTPTETANYIFFISSDNRGELWLSTDENPANKAFIASEPIGNAERDWLEDQRRPGCPDFCENRSAPVRLVAGNRYYVELLHTSGVGADNAAVTWIKEGSPLPVTGSPALTGSSIGMFAAPNSIGGVALPIGLNFGADEPDGAGTFTLGALDLAGAPGVAQINWNNFQGMSGFQDEVVDASGGPSGVTVQWQSNNTWASNGRGENNGAEFAVGTSNAALMGGYLDTGDATRTTVAISGIPAGLVAVGYDIHVYALGGVADGRSGAYRIVDAATGEALTEYIRATSDTAPTGFVQVPTGIDPTEYGAGSYLVFPELKVANIILEASTETGLGSGNPPRAPVNAVQLVPVEPIGGGEIGNIAVVRSATGITITYEGILQSSDSAPGPYADVPAASSPATLPFDGVTKFYRARR